MSHCGTHRNAKMFLFFTLLLAIPTVTDGKLITVKTSRGSVQGFDHDYGDDKTQTFYGYGQLFLGIPYAKPPLAERRYKLPEDTCQYNDSGEVHNATYYRPRCWQVRDSLQPADVMDEDCLHLNVMTPNVEGKYPVMFYIYGGSFTTGGADVYHWRGAVRNLISRGVVVVTFNYRMGVIGFFTTFTEQFPPNRGIFDMIMALKWVNEEIHNFGGDASRITIFGQSAGASAVSHLSMSPMARGLFHQMIQNSGSIMLEILTPEPERGSVDKERAQQLCNVTDADWGSAATDAELMDCLVKASPQELISYDMTTGKFWAPTIDGYFLPDYPENLAKIRPHLPLIAIDMLDEAAPTPPGSTDRLNTTGPATSLSGWLPFFHFRNNDKAVIALNEYAIDAYSGGKRPADDDHLEWMKMDVTVNSGLFFDAMFLRDIKWQIEYGNEQVWLFTLAHHSDLPFPIEIDGWLPVRHCADLPFLWFYSEIWEVYPASEGDFATADHFGRIWTEFAKTGKLIYEPAGAERLYNEIDEKLTPKKNWRQTTDDVFNVKGIELFGDIPNLTISKASWDMLNALGPKIKAKWESAKCASPVETTTKIALNFNVVVSIFIALISIILTC